MEIVWHGHSCFRITERNYATVVTDPYQASVGLPDLKLKADIVTVSHDAPGHNNVGAVKTQRQVLTSPGEFEIGSVFITGIAMDPKVNTENNHNTLFVFDYMGTTVAHMGALTYVPSQAQIERLGAVDVVLVPVGSGDDLSPSQAAEVVSLIEPAIVIPMHFATREGEDLETVDRFLKEMGVGKLDPIPSLKLVKSGLSEETQVVVLTPVG